MKFQLRHFHPPSVFIPLIKSLFAATFFSSSCLARCPIVGVFGNTGGVGESSVGMSVAMGISTSPSLTSKNAG